MGCLGYLVANAVLVMFCMGGVAAIGGGDSIGPATFFYGMLGVVLCDGFLYLLWTPKN